MEFLLSFFDFLIGIFTIPRGVFAKRPKGNEILTFKHCAVLFVVLLGLLFYFYN